MISQPTTYSLLIRDPVNKKIGVITQSKYLAIGSLVHLYNRDFGVIVSQGWPDLKLADRMVRNHILNKNTNFDIQEYLKNDEFKDFRQFGALDLNGKGYVYTGHSLKSNKASQTEENYAAIGNFLKSSKIVEQMIRIAKKNESQNILDSLYDGILEGLNSGGEVRGQQSAAVKIWNYSVMDNSSWPEVDLRVDSSPSAIEDLGKLIKEYKLYFGTTQKSVPLSAENNVIKQIMNSFNTRNPEIKKSSLNDIFRFENLEGRWINSKEIDVKALKFLKETYL